MSNWWMFAVGFLAQGLFSARILIQWIMSERARRVLSPDVFWILSLAGSILLYIYGWMRDDFPIILGQLISYYIYIWNLNIKGVWQKVCRPARIGIAALPVAALMMTASEGTAFVSRFLHNGDVPPLLLLFGSAGQIIFTLRFVYQWHYSYRRHASVLPVGFWIISLTGSAIIVIYGIVRSDPVLILGQSVGLVAYIRNIMLHQKSRAAGLKRCKRPHKH
ncbi:lipid-A-disaccharide synthase N-terminal domain-containing protein [Xylanibacter caecicola]|uniref:lipid-A-disaccharide synthase N-terminal domain-containing protein n=1 Tax=Xylanibacter caecicola TaxID=2736294 RepID=UPI0025831E87|nr:lipid-A-disaccharide synthase N-terminal domain-containing protein [Xylanibacter caecicola]